MLPEEQNSSQRGGGWSQCHVFCPFRGWGSGKNYHEFHFLGNIELYEQPLSKIIYVATYFGLFWNLHAKFSALYTGNITSNLIPHHRNVK